MALLVEAEDSKSSTANEAPPVSSSPVVAILRQHRALVSEIRAAALQNTASNGHGFGDLLPAVISRLNDYQNRLTLAETTGIWVHGRQGSAPLSPGASIATHTGSPQPAQNTYTEEHIRSYNRVTAALGESESQLAAAFQNYSILVQDNEAQPHQPLDIVRDHIKFLQQYNDTKDVGQQLIGLIAENRGVSVRSLYEDGQFGVGPLD